MLWHIIKFYMCFTLATYFKRSKIKNAHYLKVKGPVIIAMNHPNGFADPMGFTSAIYPPRVFYLARGDAFKKGIISSLLESLGIIPIFRIQDGGREGLKKNDESYSIVNKLLKRNKKIIIFAEGLCIQERRLRPLKKGVPRMIFGAMEHHYMKDLTVVPVGVNYSAPSQFRSTVFYNIGQPIHIEEYMKSYEEAPAKTMNRFLADLSPRMKELIVHIDHKRSEAVIADLEEICKYDFFKAKNLDMTNLEHDFIFSTHITSIINRAEEAQPEKVLELHQKTHAYLSSIKKEGIKDWLLIPEKQNSINYFNLTFRALCIVLTFPVYVRALLGNIIPYALTVFVVKKKVSVIEFKASFLIGIGALSFLLFYIAQFYIAKAIAPNYWWAILVIVISYLSGLFCLYLSPFRKKTKGIYKMLSLKSSSPELVASLSLQREEIISLFKSLG